MFQCINNKQIDISFSCVCSVIDHEIRYNIVKVAVDPQGDSRVDPQTTSNDNAMTKFIVNNRTDAWKTDVNLFFMVTNCQIVSVCLLTMKICQWACKNFCSNCYRKTLLLYLFHVAPFPEFAAQTDRGEDASRKHDSTSHQVWPWPF